MTSTRIRVDGVSRDFVTPAETVHALAGVSLAVEAGDLVVVYGASGSGKTTLINVMAGLDVPTSGSVVVDEQPLDGLGERARARRRLETIGVVFQDENLIPELTAGENIMLPLLARGTDRGQALEQARESLTRVGLPELLDRRPAEMSGGQRQRVGIARAIAGGRTILLADEPSGAVDTATAEGLFTLMRQLADEGAAVVISTHDPIARAHATRVVRMTDGRLTEETGVRTSA